MKVKLLKHLLVNGQFIRAGLVEASSLPEWALDASDLVEEINDYPESGLPPGWSQEEEPSQPQKIIIGKA